VFTIRECDKRTWRLFSKYHYLSDRLPGGRIYTYGLYFGADQIGFQCFANYVPTRAHMQPIYHSNRTVIHPDYAGLGMGMRLIDETALHMHQRPENYRIMAKFSSTPIYRAMSKDSNWQLQEIKRKIGKTIKGGKMQRITGFRENVTTYSFEFKPPHGDQINADNARQIPSSHRHAVR
jgi:GNAT superfamily N-acetyltransferase